MGEMESKKLNREELTEATGGVTYYDEYITGAEPTGFTDDQ